MKAVIMAGGKGTRLSGITKDIPKPMVNICGKPILEYQINNLKKSDILDIIIVVGHLGNVIKDYFGDGSSIGVNISYITEEFPMGTAGALYYVKEIIHEDFILLFGDIFINIDFKRMIQFHKDKKSLVTLFVHPNSHPHDSDLLCIDDDQKVLKLIPKNVERTEYYPNIINAGIYIASKKILDELTEISKIDFEKDIIAPLITKQLGIYAYKSTEYAKDMGTPERYEVVVEDYSTGVCESRNLSNQQKCIFLDRDGTINEHKNFISMKEELELLSNVSEAIERINRSEYLCIVITNQPVIARGECSTDELRKIHNKMETLLGMEGAYIDDLFYCPHHPDKGFEGEIKELKYDCNCRKPKTGLLEQAALKYNIDISKSWMIGDTTQDVQTGINAGAKTGLVLTGEAGKDMHYSVEANVIGNDLLDCIKMILKKED